MLQPYDFIMLTVLVGATLFGVWKGMAWQIASLASIVVSAAVAIHSSEAVAPWMPGQDPWNRWCAMAVLYVVTAAAIWIAFRLISNIINRIRLEAFDRQLGAIFGAAKGVLYCVVLTFFAVTLTEAASPIRQAVLQSRSGALIAQGIRNANPILPEDIRNWLGKYIDQLDKNLTPSPDSLPPPQPAQADGPRSTPAATRPAPAPVPSGTPAASPAPSAPLPNANKPAPSGPPRRPSR